jgi:CubicO group peptidase (beta-lactamase class C family)
VTGRSRLAVALALLPLLPPAGAKPRPLAARIDAAVADHVSPDGAGAVVGVVLHGEVVHLKAYGLADIEEETPLLVESNFDLASCSKQFTATCIMILADRGELSLDDDIREHYPELPAWNPKRPITI